MKNSIPSSKAERIVLALLEHGNHEKAATALGMSPSTVWRWLQKPEFQEQYRKARAEAYSRGMARLQHAVNAAVSTMLRIMLDTNAPASSRVRVAVAVVTTATSAFALDDVLQRLKAVEHALDVPAD